MPLLYMSLLDFPFKFAVDQPSKIFEGSTSTSLILLIVAG